MRIQPCKKMKSNNYGLHDGYIYKKLEECKHTYIYCTSVKKLLVEFIRKFRDCRYHKTPHYATNKSVIGDYLSISRAHKI